MNFSVVIVLSVHIKIINSEHTEEQCFLKFLFVTVLPQKENYVNLAINTLKIGIQMKYLLNEFTLKQLFSTHILSFMKVRANVITT